MQACSRALVLFAVLAAPAAAAAPPDGVPPVGEAAEAAPGGFHYSVREYRIDAPAADIWRLYTTTPLSRLLPSGFGEPTLVPYRIVCPGGSVKLRPEQVWPALRTGIEIQSILHWGFSNIYQDLDVTALEPNRKIGFKYAERSPAEGDQMIELLEQGAASSPSVLVRHSSHYRGKNVLYGSLYSTVHKQLLDSWHLGAKYYLESRRWAVRYCDPSAPALSGSPYARLYAEAAREARDGAAKVPQALCLYSRRFLGAASDIPRDEEQVARWVGRLAADLSRDERAALAEDARQAQADESAARAGASACAP